VDKFINFFTKKKFIQVETAKIKKEELNTEKSQKSKEVSFVMFSEI